MSNIISRFQNGEMGRNHGSVDPFAHGGLGVSIGYNMPYSSNVPFHMGYSSTLQMPPIQQPIPHVRMIKASYINLCRTRYIYIYIT